MSVEVETMSMGRGRGRRKIEMKKVENQKKRSVTFTKRRQGLFKKASELSNSCGAKTALIVFSHNGKVYSDGDVDAVFNRYLTGKLPHLEEEEEEELVEETEGFWWDKSVEEIMMEGLLAHEAALKQLKKNVEAALLQRRRRRRSKRDIQLTVACSSSSSNQNGIVSVVNGNFVDFSDGLRGVGDGLPSF